MGAINHGSSQNSPWLGHEVVYIRVITLIIDINLTTIASKIIIIPSTTSPTTSSIKSAPTILGEALNLWTIWSWITVPHDAVESTRICLKSQMELVFAGSGM